MSSIAEGLRMLLVIKKSSKLLWKNFYTLIHFTQWKSTLANHELCTVLQDFYYNGIYWFKNSVYVHCVSTLGWFFKFLSRYIIYVLIDCIFWTDHISLYKIDLSHLCIIITDYYDIYFIEETHSVLCLLLSNDKFYIHSGGSLEY